MYELDESLLAPTGSEVQCTRCQHVFTAFPPAAAEGAPAAPAIRPPGREPPAPAPAFAATAPPAPAAAPARAAPPDPAPVPAPAPRPDAAGGPRPVRTSAPAVYRPQVSAGSSGAQLPRGPVLKRDAVGMFEARLRWSSRIRWLVPAALAVLIALVAGTWALLARRGDAGAGRTLDRAMALVARDDLASAEEAVTRLTALVTQRPKLAVAAADRALALVVRAATTGEDAEALTARLADLREARERARREQRPGWQDAERDAVSAAARLEPELRAREDQARALSSGARDQLAAVEAEAGDTIEVVRARALLHALTGERDRLRRDLHVARDQRMRDPWLELADAWGDARDPEHAARERAVAKLGALAAARPALLRGRYLLARVQLSLGRRPEALAIAEGVLAANPAHEGARRIRDELADRPAPQAAGSTAAAATPPAAVAGSGAPPAPARGPAPVHAPAPVPAVAPAPPGADTAAPRRRKAVAQPGPGASVEAPAAVTAPAEAAAPVAPGPAAQPAAPAPEPAPSSAPEVAPASPPQAPRAAPAPPPEPPKAPRRRDLSPPAATDAG